jgi:DNA-binding CsgD family transcriptional regulator
MSTGNRKTTVKRFRQQQLENPERLSPMQVGVIRRLCSGDSTQGIANYFGLSPYTILNHLKAAYKKLGVSERSQVVVKAVQLGIAAIPIRRSGKRRR